jgi:hypothetical protein
MMEEQLAQTQTIEALRREVETSNNSAREAQALLRTNQEQQLQHSRILPPSIYLGHHQQHSLCAPVFNSINGYAHKGAS